MPDATTWSRLRIDLAEARLAEAVFMAPNARLGQRGWIIKTGAMIDATLVEADVRRPPLREGEAVMTDPAAGLTRRGQRSFCSCKAHRAVAQGADPIRRAVSDQRRHRGAHRCPDLWQRGGGAGGQRSTRPRAGAMPWRRPASATGSCTGGTRASSRPPGTSG
ncbi:MAG TPA: hypothetical protein VNS22_02445 [Geminicoccus sp.]|uniref:hypothetical protein n=1 Tax=Geminicoccus sp. TaxID=2024832 RepID=UPI002C9AAA92|nr:hypothetical protein [Geminicoccus sp.]HWL67224.1 hypothetical protein [Geminicoccus sp.]